jgi:histidyl-tRNA synthetase
MLWANGFNAETSYKEKSDPEGQTRYALENYFTFIVWIGESELDAG